MGDGASEDADREAKPLIADIISLVRGPALLLRYLAPLEELQSELAAVRTQIERTDRLIDQVVYRLYGLTEEEIKIVQEAT